MTLIRYMLTLVDSIYFYYLPREWRRSKIIQVIEWPEPCPEPFDSPMDLEIVYLYSETKKDGSFILKAVDLVHLCSISYTYGSPCQESF